MKLFEKEAIKLLLEKRLDPRHLQRIVDEASVIDYEYTGSGYYLKIGHAEIPFETSTWSEPVVQGKYGEITCGFVVFLANKNITLECHSWGEFDVPENFRDCDVKLLIQTQ